MSRPEPTGQWCDLLQGEIIGIRDLINPHFFRTIRPYVELRLGNQRLLI